MARVNKTKFAILGMLSIEPMSGYDIKTVFKESTNSFWSESNGQLYPTLAALNEQALVTCHEEISHSSKTRKVYSITQSGQNALNNWLKRPIEKPLYRNELLLKILYGSNTSKQHCMEQLKTQQQEVQESLQELELIKQKMISKYIGSDHLFYWQLVLDYSQRMLATELTWCEDAINRLRE